MPFLNWEAEKMAKTMTDGFFISHYLVRLL